MAARLKHNIEEDYLTCSICFNIFTDPRQLSCGHSYCIQCLVEYLKSTTSSQSCPTCRQAMNCPKSTEIQTWIQTLPQDLLLKGIINAVKKHDPDQDHDDDETINGGKTLQEKTVCDKHIKCFEYFCSDHQDILCSECVAELHKKCVSSPISELQLKALSELNEIDSNVVRNLKDMSEIEQKGILNLVSYQNKKEETLFILSSLRKQFEKFSSLILTDIKAKETSLNWPEVNMKSVLKAIRIHRSHLEQFRDDIVTTTREINIAKKQKDVLEIHKAADTLLNKAEINYSCFRDYKISFESNDILISSISKVKEVANIEISSDVDIDYHADETLSVIEPETDFMMYRKREFSVNQETDLYRSLSGICLLDNSLIIIDQYNNNAMKMTLDGECVGNCSLTEPYQVCKSGNTGIAITCWDKNVIFILDTEPILSIKKVVKTNKHYLGISGAGKDRYLVTSPDSSIDVISTSGEILFSIDSRKQSNIFSSLFRKSASVPVKAMLKDETVIMCDSIQKTLVCMDFAGRILWQRKIPGISNFTCGPEEIYCTLSCSNRVLRLTFDGNIADNTFLNIRHPWAIDTQGQTVVITEDSPSEKYHIIKLE